MKNKWLKKAAWSLLAVFTLASCGTNQEKPQEKAEPESAETEENRKELFIARFELQDGEEVFADYPVDFEKGATVFEVLSDNFDVEAEETEFGQYVKGIDSHFEDPAEGKYWLFYVNGKMADVSADKYELQDGDKVKWVLEKN